VTDSRTSGRTSAARVPSARATSTTSYSAATPAITCTMRGSRARAIFSIFSSSATFCALSSVPIGSVGAYSARLLAMRGARASFTRLLWPAAAMLRTVRAASSRLASEMSSL